MVVCTTIAFFLGYTLSGDHTLDYRTELERLTNILGSAVFRGVKLGIAYLALEPYVRRHWPWQLIGWVRLLAGRWRDPRVGTDILIGLAFGVGFASCEQSLRELPGVFGLSTNPRYPISFGIGLWSAAPLLLAESFTRGTSLFFALFLLTRLLKSVWLGLAATVIVGVAFLGNMPTDSPLLYYTGATLLGVISVGILFRFGLLTGMVVLFTHYFVCWSLITWDVNTWYWWGTLLHFAILLVLAGYALVVSVGGRRGLR
jgi:serine/threonine-protein kinase